MTTPLDQTIRALRDIAYAWKVGMDIPDGIDVGTTCWTSADVLESGVNASEQPHTLDLEGAAERAEGRSSKLTEALGMLLPLARQFGGIAPEHGGPDPVSLVLDPLDGAWVLQEVLDAQMLLEDGIPRPAEAMDFASLPREAFLEDHDELPLIPKTEIGQSVEEALAHAHSLLQRRNMLRIAGIPLAHGQHLEYEETLKVLYMRLQEHLATSDD